MSQRPEQEAQVSAEKVSVAAAPRFYDEIEERPGTLRPHWRPLIQSLERLGPSELASRAQEGRRLIREHGVTYSAYGDPKGMERPWGLDLIPFLITGEEWSHLEAGLIQRTRLFNLILADLYGGAQRLLRDGFIPPELIFGNPAFLRPCRGIRIPAQVYVHLHACDLGRSPDGQWWVLADRTQAPGGAGYAWENRTVLSRLLPEQIRDGNVPGLGSFFRQQREMLFELAPSGCPHPSVVLLTPGPHSEIYFEHAYLARHLGFPLVEGADLTVRDRRVYLKTVEGLQPIDVILRRVDDFYCDPLELRGDSMLGVPGLVDAARAGTVTIANALGAGLMESPALLEFLPALSRHLLGEDLRLPSIPTWWCGSAEGLRCATNRLDSLLLKPAFGAQRWFQLPMADRSDTRASAAMLAQLRDKLLATPEKFVVQERLQLSRAPTSVEGQLTARSVVLRTFIASGSQAVAVLPGGLTRVSNAAEDPVGSMQSGGGSKDTWILSSAARHRVEPGLVPSDTRSPDHVLSGIPSRAADHLFWLGRYTERLEQLLRRVRCVLGRLSNENDDDLHERTGLTELTAHLGLLADTSSEVSSTELSARVLTLLYAKEEPGGISDLVRRIRFTASAVRDRFSGDTWRILGRIDQDAAPTVPSRLPIAGATGFIHSLILDLAAFSGVEMENMTRGTGWRFLDLGRRLERGLSVVQLLRAALCVVTEPEFVLEPVLEIADSVMTYRRLHFDRPRWPGVLAVVLRDESNPRSLAFQVNALLQHAAALIGDAPCAETETEDARLTAMANTLRCLDLNALLPTSEPSALLELLDSWSADLASLSDQITNRYFTHAVLRTS